MPTIFHPPYGWAPPEIDRHLRAEPDHARIVSQSHSRHDIGQLGATIQFALSGASNNSTDTWHLRTSHVIEVPERPLVADLAVVHATFMCVNVTLDLPQGDEEAGESTRTIHCRARPFAVDLDTGEHHAEDVLLDVTGRGPDDDEWKVTSSTLPQPGHLEVREFKFLRFRGKNYGTSGNVNTAANTINPGFTSPPDTVRIRVGIDTLIESAANDWSYNGSFSSIWTLSEVTVTTV